MNFIKRWLRGWRLVGLIALVLIIFLIAHGIYRKSHDTSNILTAVVQKQDLKQTVLATGVVTSSTDLKLSFKNSGTVKQVNVKVGQQVSGNQILATLDQKDQLASLTSARGSLASAQANYDKVLAGASNEDIAVAQAAVDAAQTSLNNTQNQEDVLVQNALNSLLNSTPSATPSGGNIGSETLTISGSYNSTAQGTYHVVAQATSSGARATITGLESDLEDVHSNSSVPLGKNGLFIQFSTTNIPNGDAWDIQIPNTKASNYVANSNAYQAALQTQASAVSAAQSSLTQAQASLALKKAEARPADLEAAQAQILSAQGQVQAAEAALENTIIRAPTSGTITKIDINAGDTASSLAEAMVLQNISQLHLEADISEANIAEIQSGQTVDVTFDALGPDQHFTATVTNLDLSSTVVSGIVNYKLTASLDKTDSVKPGMTANMTILTGTRSQVLAVPSSAIIIANGQNYIRVITDPKRKTYNQVAVQTGFQADGGLIEITSGLTAGQEIVTYIK